MLVLFLKQLFRKKSTLYNSYQDCHTRNVVLPLCASLNFPTVTRCFIYYIPLMGEFGLPLWISLVPLLCTCCREFSLAAHPLSFDSSSLVSHQPPWTWEPSIPLWKKTRSYHYTATF